MATRASGVDPTTGEMTVDTLVCIWFHGVARLFHPSSLSFSLLKIFFFFFHHNIAMFCLFLSHHVQIYLHHRFYISYKGKKNKTIFKSYIKTGTFLQKTFIGWGNCIIY